MSDYRSRLFIEHGELVKKKEKLKDFIISDKYEDLPDVDKLDLKEQLKHMEGYCSVLLRRVSRCCG